MLVFSVRETSREKHWAKLSLLTQISRLRLPVKSRSDRPLQGKVHISFYHSWCTCAPSCVSIPPFALSLYIHGIIVWSSHCSGLLCIIRMVAHEVSLIWSDSFFLLFKSSSLRLSEYELNPMWRESRVQGASIPTLNLRLWSLQGFYWGIF